MRKKANGLYKKSNKDSTPPIRTPLPDGSVGIGKQLPNGNYAFYERTNEPPPPPIVAPKLADRDQQDEPGNECCPLCGGLGDEASSSMTVTEFAARQKISATKAWDLIEQYRLPVVDLGPKTKRITEKVVADFLKARGKRRGSRG